MKDWIFEEDREKFQDPKVCKQKKLCNGPFEFLKHIEKLKDSCQAHAIIWWYLNFLFENYHAKGIRHIGFEEIKTKEYKKAQETINLEIRQ